MIRHGKFLEKTNTFSGVIIRQAIFCMIRSKKWLKFRCSNSMMKADTVGTKNLSPRELD